MKVEGGDRQITGRRTWTEIDRRGTDGHGSPVEDGVRALGDGVGRLQGEVDGKVVCQRERWVRHTTRDGRLTKMAPPGAAICGLIKPSAVIPYDVKSETSPPVLGFGLL